MDWCKENLQVLPQKYGNVLKFPFQPILGINRCGLIQVPLFCFFGVGLRLTK